MRRWAEQGSGVRDTATAALFGGMGAFAFVTLGVPAGALIGALAACALRTTLGPALKVPRASRAPLLAGMGIATGLGVTPGVLRQAAAWPVSLAMLLVATIAMTVAGYWLYRRLSALDPETAFFCAVPGAFASITMIAEDRASDFDKIVAAHLLRVLALLSLAPLLVLPVAKARHASLDVGMLHGSEAWLAVIGVAAAGFLAAKFIRLPLPFFLGPLFGVAVTTGTGLVALHPPPLSPHILGAGLGAFIGARLDLKLLIKARRHLVVSLLVFVVAGLVGALIGAAAGTLVGAGPAAGVLAFAPGSMETMIAIALSLKVNASYVAVHHIARIIWLVAALPILDRLLFRPVPIETTESS